MDSFASALQWGERNNRALTLTTQATAALIELSTVLPAELAADDLSDTHAARQPRVARGRPAVPLGPAPPVLLTSGSRAWQKRRSRPSRT